MSEYIGSRIVPKPCGEWDKTKEYEVLSVVLLPSSGDSYIARKDVPVGTAIMETEYWMLCSDFSLQLKAVQDDVSELQDKTDTLAEQIAANVAASTDSDADYAAEVVDARVTADGEEKISLGEAIRAVGSEVAGARIDIGKEEYGDLGAAMESFSSAFIFQERVEISNNNVVLKGKGDYTTASYENIKDGNGVVRAVKFTAEIMLDYDISSIMTHTYIPISVFNEKFYGKSLIIQLYSPVEGYMNFSLGSSASGGDGDL